MITYKKKINLYLQKMAITQLKRDAKISKIFVSLPDAKKIHIIPRNDDGTSWAVKRETSRRAKFILPSLEEAIEVANKYKTANKKIVIHKAFGEYEYL